MHLLATPNQENSISKVFQSVGRKYVQYFNFTYKRSGTLWEGRYRATVVDSEQYLLKLMRYIELNPVQRTWSRIHVTIAGRATPSMHRARLG